MRGEVPKGVHIAANGAKIRPARIEVVDPATLLLYVLFHLADAGVEDKCVAHHQRRGMRVRQLNQFFRVRRRRGERLFYQHVLACQQ